MTSLSLDEQLSALNGPRGYHAQTIPSALDAALLLSFESLGTGEMRKERDRIEKKHRGFADILGIFGLRMATLAVRKREPRLATVGLKAFVSMRESRDVRDDIVVASLFYDALRRSGGDPGSVFTQVALESATDRELLQNFLARSEKDRSIEAMGYRAEGSEETFRYVYQR